MDTLQLKKLLIYWILILLFNYGITVGAHYLCRPFWFDEADNNTSLTEFETYLTIAILPFLLVTANYWFAKKMLITKLFFINAITILSCIFISVRLHFLNWADSVGSRTHPDIDTLEVNALERDIGLTVTTIGLIIVFVRLNKKKKRLELSQS